MGTERSKEQSECVVSMLPQAQSTFSQQALPKPVRADNTLSHETAACIQGISELEPNEMYFYNYWQKTIL